MILQCKKNQGVQCTIQDSSTNIGTNEHSKQSASTKPNVSKKNENNCKLCPILKSQNKFYNFVPLLMNIFITFDDDR